jgi:hypothetical protein
VAASVASAVELPQVAQLHSRQAVHPHDRPPVQLGNARQVSGPLHPNAARLADRCWVSTNTGRPPAAAAAMSATQGVDGGRKG